MDCGTVIPLKKSGFCFERETEERIGLDLVELAQEGMAGSDVSQMSAFFTLLLRQLEGDAALAYLCAQAIEFVPEPGRPVFSRPLLSTPDIRVSIIGLHPLRPVPMHDHPGQWGLQQVITGRMRVRRFDCLGEQSSNETLAILSLLDDSELGPGDSSMVTPARANIHELAAQGIAVVLMSIQTQPRVVRPQSWFIPENSMLDSPGGLFCNRIRKRFCG